MGLVRGLSQGSKVEPDKELHLNLPVVLTFTYGCVYAHTSIPTHTHFSLKLLQIQLHFDERKLTLDIVVLGKFISLLLDPVGVQNFVFLSNEE